MPLPRPHKRPLVALVGRTNVGKSRLWNRLTETGTALVSSSAHTTRDRQYAPVLWRGVVFELIDTGGLDTENDDIGRGIQAQSERAIREAALVLFVMDGQAGVLPQDQELARHVKRLHRHVWLVVNKIDRLALVPSAHEPSLYQLNLDDPKPVSAATSFGIGDVLDEILIELERLGHPAVLPEETEPLRLAIVGRPNVGKSSLVNAILGETRVIVSPIPHTTREPQDTWIRYRDRDIVLIDTAGMRKKTKHMAAIEEQGVEQNLRVIEAADVACLVFDVTEDPTAQDRHLAGLLEGRSTGIVLVANKWDLVEKKHTGSTKEYEALIRQLFPFLKWAPMVFVSALTGQRASGLLDRALEIQAERLRHIDYNALNRLLKACIKAKKPLPTYGPQSPRIYDVAQVGHAPPTFLITVLGEKESVHSNWIHFFERRLRDKFGFGGTPIVVKARNLPRAKSTKIKRLPGPGMEAVAGKIHEPVPRVNQTRRRQKR